MSQFWAGCWRYNLPSPLPTFHSTTQHHIITFHNANHVWYSLYVCVCLLDGLLLLRSLASNPFLNARLQLSVCAVSEAARQSAHMVALCKCNSEISTMCIIKRHSKVINMLKHYTIPPTDNSISHTTPPYTLTDPVWACPGWAARGWTGPWGRWACVRVSQRGRQSSGSAESLGHSSACPE